jgi:hypothetical protein
MENMRKKCALAFLCLTEFPNTASYHRVARIDDDEGFNGDAFVALPLLMAFPSASQY